MTTLTDLPGRDPAPRDRSPRSTPEVGAIATAALLLPLGVALSTLAHAVSQALFEPLATAPTASEIAAAGPGPWLSLVPFLCAAFFHLFAILVTQEREGARRAWAIVGIDAGAVTATGLAFGRGDPAAVLVLAIALAASAALGHGLAHLWRWVRSPKEAS